MLKTEKIEFFRNFGVFKNFNFSQGILNKICDLWWIEQTRIFFWIFFKKTYFFLMKIFWPQLSVAGEPQPNPNLKNLTFLSDFWSNFWCFKWFSSLIFNSPLIIQQKIWPKKEQHREDSFFQKVKKLNKKRRFFCQFFDQIYEDFLASDIRGGPTSAQPQP